MAHVEDRWFREIDGRRVRTSRYEQGQRWRVRYRDPEGRERYKSFPRKPDAERFANEVETSKGRGEWIDPVHGRMSYAEWAVKWLATKTARKPKTIAGYESLLRSRILPTFGRVPLAKITHLAVGEWVAAMTAEGLSPSRIRQAYRVLSQSLDAAVRADFLARNVAKGSELPRLPRGEMRCLDHRHVRALADACGEEEGLLVLVLAYTGLRLGEAFALRSRRVDLLRSRVVVAESLADVNGDLIFGPTKTHQQRTVGFPAFLRAPLARHLAGLGPDDLVFTDTRGGPLRYGNWRRRVWDRATLEAGLEGLKPHELRHTCASLLHATGASAKDVSMQLGHASVQVTLDRYTHLYGGELDRLAERLDSGALDALASRARPEDRSNVLQLRPSRR